MDEQGLEASLGMYKTQLSQVETALQAAGEENNEDLVKLRGDLKELIQLTEDSLLSLKKSRLLAMIGEDGSQNESENGSCSKPESGRSELSDMDAEFAAFQAAIAEETSENIPSKSVSADITVSSEGQSGGEDDSDLDEIVGSKCRAPHSHDWGEKQYLNAMIIGVEPLEADNEPQVWVMFCNPTHQSLVPCTYYLEGRCKFTAEQCRYSHGHIVPVEDLHEFKDADHSVLKMESKCLAKYEDGVWYKATVVDIGDDHTFEVMYDSYDETCTVGAEDILPIDSDRSEPSSDEDEERELVALSEDSEEEEEDALPVYLWRPPQTTEALGQWEAHTRGIASKLMAKMGFVVGQGLGKNGEGRAEPVPIQLLPSGKSLDKIMELKAIAGDRDLFDVMKKHKRKMKKQEAKVAAGYTKKAEKPNVFDFINKKLGHHKKGSLNELKTRGAAKTRRVHISEADLKTKTDRSLNVQLLQTSEEMRGVERELSRLRQSLGRNEGRDKGMTIRVQQKIASMEKYLEQLKSSETSIEKHRQSRRDQKKLTVF